MAEWGRGLFDKLTRAEEASDETLKEFEKLESALEPAVALMEEVAQNALDHDTFGAHGIYVEAVFVKRLVETARDIVFELLNLRAYGLQTLTDAERAGRLLFQECNY